MQEISQMTHEVLTDLKKKDPRALERVYKFYWKRLCAYAYSLYNDSEICEDVVQEVFISLWERAGEPKILELQNYLFRATKYRILNHIRGLKGTANGNSHFQQLPSPMYVENPLEYREFETEVITEIKNLPPKCRRVFVMSRLNQLSNAEIADELNLSVRTVETHISKALKILRLKLQPELV